jgi:rhodanese-related sulfurtransferase
MPKASASPNVPSAHAVTPNQLKASLHTGEELALLDVRENGRFGDGHLLFACSVPLSRLEMRIADLVPRRTAPIVLCDEDEGLAERAAERIRGLGYADVRTLMGGIEGWRSAGFEIFSGVHVPSKAFGEFVEHQCHTPSLSATELKARVDQGEKLVILDSRPLDEFRAMSIPGALDCPGAELVYRVAEVAPDPGTLVVVNCAGRTRSIIGAQSLRNAGIPNPVLALRNGTMGWHLAGLKLERGSSRSAPAPSPRALAQARAAAARVARRYRVRSVEYSTVKEWRLDPGRTTYLLDVRSPEEFVAGHVPDSRSAPGGQLVQATDAYVATRNARLVLLDDTGVRATLTASWLLQMGWRDVWICSDALAKAQLVAGPSQPAVLGLDSAHPPEMDAATLAAALKLGKALVVDLATSPHYKSGHIPGAWFAVRSRFEKSLPQLPRMEDVILTSNDGVLARLAAADASAVLGRPVHVLRGGTEAWSAQGLALNAGAECMADTADDVWLRPYDRDAGQEAAMQAYLTWEVDLVEQINRDGDARFQILGPE